MLNMLSSAVCFLFSFLQLVSPELFGALGDGVHDDAPAFNECLKRGGISLRQGAAYRLCTSLDGISGDCLDIDGNGASIIVDEAYPFAKYQLIFSFTNEREREYMKVSNVNIISELGQKFADRNETGDSYIFFIHNVKLAEFSGVTFEDRGIYNNLTFLSTYGCDLHMKDCSISSHSLSRQGGAVWFMDQYRQQCTISFENVRFDYDTQDECVCIAVNPRYIHNSAALNAVFKKCSFTSRGDSPSSGFNIVYNHCPSAHSDISVRYSDCDFRYSGKNVRHVQTYQAQDASVFPSRSSFVTDFIKCRFYFHPLASSDYGLFGLIQDDSNAADKDKVLYRFKKCIFDIDRVEPLIGDRDGGCKGCYVFEKCTINASSRVFTRKYNPGVGDIDIHALSCKIKSGDDFLTSENLTAKSTSFVNKFGIEVSVRRSPEVKKNASVSTRRCSVNGRKIVDVKSADEVTVRHK